MSKSKIQRDELGDPIPQIWKKSQDTPKEETSVDTAINEKSQDIFHKEVEKVEKQEGPLDAA